MKYFEEITKVPRPSGQLSAIQNYLTSFAEAHTLEYEKDAAGNVLIKHPGFSKKHIIFQAHQDMVPAVRDGSSFVFGKDEVNTYVKDGWMYAEETSLGADDGTGMAVMLDALVSDELKDCGFNCIFTADEETTMNGAKNISAEWLSADALINIDSEDWGSVCVSCAGGAVVEAVFHPEREEIPVSFGYLLSVSGLRSGHSGIMIDSGRLNAVRTAAEFLLELHDVQIVSCTGGSAKNVIPGTAEFIFTASDDNIASFAAEFAKVKAVGTDPDLMMFVDSVSLPQMPWTKYSSGKLLSALSSVPNGCFKRSASGPLLSSNLGVLRTAADGTVFVTCFVRGNDNAECEIRTAEIQKFFDDAGANTLVSDKFPGWKEKDESPLLQMVKDVYGALFNADITVCTTHGGLEGGYFAEKNPALQIVSIGPDIENPHTVFERLNVESFLKLKEFVYALVKESCRR